MTRSINVSTDVYAAIWGARKEGEDSENAVLARILRCKPSTKSNAPIDRYAKGSGVYDARNNVRFEEGFEIFRSYKGKLFTAEAKAGVWLRTDTGVTYGTLNQLNNSIAAGAENVWNGNWKFRTPDGEELSIGTLRVK